MTVDELLAHVRRGDDVEGLRDEVDDDKLQGLAAAYPQLDWNQRSRLVELLQDAVSPDTRPMMHDFLMHSPEVIGSRDEANMARAIALCHVDGRLEDFERYLSNPALVDARRRHG